MPRVPQRFLHKVNAENENERADNHDSYGVTYPYKVYQRAVGNDARMYAIGQVPIIRSKSVAIASINPATRFPPPTR